MKYIIPENKIDKIIFKYLNMIFKGLEIAPGKHGYDGIVFAYPNVNYGKLGYQNGVLYVYYEYIDEISSIFGLEEYDSEEVISRWVSDKFQLEVNGFVKLFGVLYFESL